jgi:hypothetical protein
MHASVSRFTASKRCATVDDNEDADCVQGDGLKEDKFDGPYLCAAVADGASEAMLSGRWARHLVETVGPAPWGDRFVDLVMKAAKSWPQKQEAYVQDRESRGRPLQWFEEPKFARGPYATLVRLRLRSEPEKEFGHWECDALGDACMFHVRSDGKLKSFPIKHHSEFTSTPHLIGAKQVTGDLLETYTKSEGGCWQPGDIFYLATDAVAEWMLRSDSRGDSPWRILRDLDTDGVKMSFAEWVEERRTVDHMRDDDVTLVRIDIHDM